MLKQWEIYLLSSCSTNIGRLNFWCFIHGWRVTTSIESSSTGSMTARCNQPRTGCSHRPSLRRASSEQQRLVSPSSRLRTATCTSKGSSREWAWWCTEGGRGIPNEGSRVAGRYASCSHIGSSGWSFSIHDSCNATWEKKKSFLLVGHDIPEDEFRDATGCLPWVGSTDRKASGRDCMASRKDCTASRKNHMAWGRDRTSELRSTSSAGRRAGSLNRTFSEVNETLKSLEWTPLPSRSQLPLQFTHFGFCFIQLFSQENFEIRSELFDVSTMTELLVDRLLKSISQSSLRRKKVFCLRFAGEKVWWTGAMESCSMRWFWDGCRCTAAVDVLCMSVLIRLWKLKFLKLFEVGVGWIFTHLIFI